MEFKVIDKGNREYEIKEVADAIALDGTPVKILTPTLVRVDVDELKRIKSNLESQIADLQAKVSKVDQALADIDTIIKA